MLGPARAITVAAVSAALVIAPTGAIAADPASPPQPTARQAATAAATSPWLTLSAMTGNSSSALVAATAAQNGDDGDDCGDDVQPQPGNGTNGDNDDDDDACGQVPIAPLAVVLGTIALGIWILVHEDSEDSRGNISGSGNGRHSGLLGGFVNPLSAIPISPA